MNEPGSQSTSFSIPKLKRSSTEGVLRKIIPKSHEGNDILGGMARAYLDPHFSGLWDTKSVSMVDNREMEKEYRKKKSEMKVEGRSGRELQEHFAFRCIKDHHSLTKIVKEGYKVKPGHCNILGKSDCGVYVSRHPDVELRNLKGVHSAILMVFKVILGRCKMVSPAIGETMEPTPNYDSHVCNRPAQIMEDDIKQYKHAQVYLYEYNDDALPSTKPRHCLPFAVIHMLRVSPSSLSAYNQVRSNYTRNLPPGLSRSTAPPRVPAPQHTNTLKEPDQAEEANKAPRVVPASVTCGAPAPMMRSHLEIGRGEMRLMMRRNSGPEAATLPPTLSPVLSPSLSPSLSPATEPTPTDSNSLCVGCMYPSIHCPTHGEVVKHRVAGRSSGGGILVHPQRQDVPVTAARSFPSPPVTPAAQHVSSPFDDMRKKMEEVFGQARVENVTPSQDTVLPPAGSVSQVQVAEVLPTQRHPLSLPVQQTWQVSESSLKSRCFSSAQPPPSMVTQRSDLDYSANVYPTDARGIEDRWSGDKTMMSSGVASTSTDERWQRHSMQQLSSEAPFPLLGSAKLSQTSVPAGAAVTLPPNFKDLAAQIQKEDLKKILANCSSETKEMPKPIRNSSLYRFRRKKKLGSQAEQHADALLTSQPSADADEVCQQSTASEPQQVFSSAETSVVSEHASETEEVAQLPEDLNSSSERSSQVAENETKFDGEREKITDAPKEQSSVAVDRTEIVERSPGEQGEVEAVLSDACDESKRSTQTDSGENQSVNSRESVNSFDGKSTQEANSSDVFRSCDEVPMKPHVAKDANINCSEAGVDRSSSPSLQGAHDESSRLPERPKDLSTSRESHGSSDYSHSRRYSDPERESYTRHKDRRDSPTRCRGRRVSYRDSKSPPMPQDRCRPLRDARGHHGSSDDYHSSSARGSHMRMEGRRLHEEDKEIQHRPDDEDHDYRPGRGSRYQRTASLQNDRQIIFRSHGDHETDSRMAGKSWKRRDSEEETRPSYQSRGMEREDLEPRHSQSMTEMRTSSMDCELPSRYYSRRDDASYAGVHGASGNLYGPGFSRKEEKNEGSRKSVGEKGRESVYPESYETLSFRSRDREEKTGDRNSAYSSATWPEDRLASQKEWSEGSRERFRSVDLHYTRRRDSREMKGNSVALVRAGRDGALADAAYCTGASQSSYSAGAPTKEETLTRQPVGNTVLSSAGDEPPACQPKQDDHAIAGFWLFPAMGSQSRTALEGNQKSPTHTSAKSNTSMAEDVIKVEMESSTAGDSSVKSDGIMGVSEGYWGPPVEMPEETRDTLLALDSASALLEQKTETNVMDDRDSSRDIESKLDVPKGTTNQGRSEVGGKAKKKKVDRDMTCYKRRRKKKKNKSASSGSFEESWPQDTSEGGDEESLSLSDILSNHSRVPTPDVMLVDFVKIPLTENAALSCQSCEEARKPLVSVKISGVRGAFSLGRDAERVAASARAAGAKESSSPKIAPLSPGSGYNTATSPATSAAGPNAPVVSEPASLYVSEPASLYGSDESTLDALTSANEELTSAAVSISEAPAEESACTDRVVSSARVDSIRIFPGGSDVSPQVCTAAAGSRSLADNVRDPSLPEFGSASVDESCCSVTASETEKVHRKAPSGSNSLIEQQITQTESSPSLPSDPSSASNSASTTSDAAKSSVHDTRKIDEEELKSVSSQLQVQAGLSEEASSTVDSSMTRSLGEVDLVPVSAQSEIARQDVLSNDPLGSASANKAERDSQQREDAYSILEMAKEDTPPSVISSSVGNTAMNNVAEVAHPTEIKVEPKVPELRESDRNSAATSAETCLWEGHSGKGQDLQPVKECPQGSVIVSSPPVSVLWKQWKSQNPDITVTAREEDTEFGTNSSSELMDSSEQSPVCDGTPGFQGLDSTHGKSDVFTASVPVERLCKPLENFWETEGLRAAKSDKTGHSVDRSRSGAGASYVPKTGLRGAARPKMKGSQRGVKDKMKNSNLNQSSPVDNAEHEELNVFGTHTTSWTNPLKRLSISICVGKHSKQGQAAKEEQQAMDEPVTPSDLSCLPHPESSSSGKPFETTLTTFGKEPLRTRFPPSTGQAIPVLGAIKSSTPSQGKTPVEMDVSKAPTPTTSSASSSTSYLAGQPLYMRAEGQSSQAPSPANIAVLVTGTPTSHTHGIAPKQPGAGSNPASGAVPGGLSPISPARFSVGFEPSDVPKPISSVISASKFRFTVDPTPSCQSSSLNAELKSSSSSERVYCSLEPPPTPQSEECQSSVLVAASASSKEFHLPPEVRGSPIETLGKGNLPQNPAGQQVSKVSQSSVFHPPTCGFSFPPPATPLLATRPILQQHIPTVSSLQPHPLCFPPSPEVHPPLSSQVHRPPPPSSQVHPTLSQVQPHPPNQLHHPPPSQMQSPPLSQMHQPPLSQMHHPPPSPMRLLPSSQGHASPQVQSLPPQVRLPPPFGQPLRVQVNTQMLPPPPRIAQMPTEHGLRIPVLHCMVSTVASPIPAPGSVTSGQMISSPFFLNVHQPPPSLPTSSTSVPSSLGVMAQPRTVGSSGVGVLSQPPLFVSTSMPPPVSLHSHSGSLQSSPDVQGYPSMPSYPSPSQNEPVLSDAKPPHQPKKQDLADWFSDKINPHKTASVLDDMSATSHRKRERSSDILDTFIKKSRPKHDTDDLWAMAFDKTPSASPKSPSVRSGMTGMDTDKKLLSFSKNLRRACTPSSDRGSTPERASMSSKQSGSSSRHRRSSTPERQASMSSKQSGSSSRHRRSSTPERQASMSSKQSGSSSRHRRSFTPERQASMSSKQSGSSSRLRRSFTPERQASMSSKQSGSSSRHRRSSTPERQTGSHFHDRRTSSPIISNKDKDNLSAKPLEYLKKRREMLLSTLEKLPAAENASSASPKRQESQRERSLQPMQKERKITVISHHRQENDDTPIQEGSSRFPANEKSCPPRNVQKETRSPRPLCGTSAKLQVDEVTSPGRDSVAQDKDKQPSVEKDFEEAKIETIPLLLNTQMVRHGKAPDIAPVKSRKSRFDVVPAASSSRFTVTCESSTSNATAVEVASPKQRTVGLLPTSSKTINLSEASLDSNTPGTSGPDKSAAMDTPVSEIPCRRVFITLKGADDSTHQKQVEDDCPVPRKVFVSENSAKCRFPVRSLVAAAEQERSISKSSEKTTENSLTSQRFHVTLETRAVEKAEERSVSQAAHNSCEEEMGESPVQRTGESGVSLGRHKAPSMDSMKDGCSAAKRNRNSNDESSDLSQCERIISMKAKCFVKTEPMDTSFDEMQVPHDNHASQTKQDILLPPVALENISDAEDNFSDISDEGGVDVQEDPSNCTILHEYIKYKLMVPDPRVICEKLVCPGDFDLGRVGPAEACRLKKKCRDLAREYYESLPKEERPRNFLAAVQVKGGTLKHLHGRLEVIRREQLERELKIVRVCIQELNSFFLNPEPKLHSVSPRAPGAGIVHIPGVGKMENFKVKTLNVEENVKSAKPLSHDHEDLLTSSLGRFPKREPCSEEDADDFDKLEYSSAPELCQDMIVVPGFGKMSVENYLLHKEALEQAEGDLIEAIRVHVGGGILPHQKLPHELLTQGEKDRVFSEERNFLYLFCSMPKGPYSKLLNMNLHLGKLEANVAECLRENRVTDLLNARAKLTKIHEDRRKVMTTFVGSIGGKRIRRLTTLKIRYRLLLDYLYTQLDPADSKQLFFLRTQLGAISKHLRVVQREMASSLRFTHRYYPFRK